MINEYLNYLRNIRGLSENTTMGYEKDLHKFLRWIQANHQGARWSTITRTHLDQFVTELAEEGLKPASTNRILSAISGLYGYMKRQGFDVENPAKFESRRKVAKALPNTIPVEDLRRAYDHTTGAVHTMIGLLVTTGIRIQELLDLNWEDIDFKEHSLKIFGKGAKGRMVYTTPEVLVDLAIVKNQLHPSGRMFWFDQRTARHMLWEVLKDFSQAPQLSPHAIRHTMATNMAKRGANVVMIGTILGHEHLKTTQKYIDMAQVETRQACQQYTMFN